MYTYVRIYTYKICTHTQVRWAASDCLQLPWLMESLGEKKVVLYTARAEKKHRRRTEIAKGQQTIDSWEQAGYKKLSKPAPVEQLGDADEEKKDIVDPREDGFDFYNMDEKVFAAVRRHLQSPDTPKSKDADAGDDDFEGYQRKSFGGKQQREWVDEDDDVDMGTLRSSERESSKEGSRKRGPTRSSSSVETDKYRTDERETDKDDNAQESDSQGTKKKVKKPQGKDREDVTWSDIETDEGTGNFKDAKDEVSKLW